jgi:hypothetical protein
VTVCLLDLPGRYLVLTCKPCGRCGRASILRLRHEHGDLARVDEVMVRLTQSCRHQQAAGNHHRAYNGGCQVAFDVDVPWNGRGTGRARG